mgnify:CR=1 FL=1
MHDLGGVFEGAAHVFLDKLRVLAEHLLDRHAIGQAADNHGDGDARATNARVAVVNGGVYRNSFFPQVACHRWLPLFSCGQRNRESNESGERGAVRLLQGGIT